MDERKPQTSEDHGYSLVSTGEKRKNKEEIPTGKRTEKSKGLVVGDSLIKGMVEDQGLNRTALEQGWEIRMKRGGVMRDVEDMIDKENLQD